ncbi:MAG: MoxR family ATPase [Deltaproteobacteria bacterium]|nr:MoxR family ATPase [Deltaproteobacteria bacterium]
MTESQKRIPMTANDFQPSLSIDYPLDKIGSWPASKHRFDEDSILAVRTALACNRPLLVRGEPGIGKSQLARAVATYFEVPFLSFVVTSRSECSDLLYFYDAVSRLSQAQVQRHAGDHDGDWRAELAEEKFVRPGKLWWAINWESAALQARRSCPHCRGKTDSHECCPQCGEPERGSLNGWKPGMGCVLLIDEIDKADSDFPNGLLESLGNTGFEVSEARCSVQADIHSPPPLVMVTTNEDRELPPAFLRRCLVLQMVLGSPDKTPQQFLVDRGKIHCSDIAAAVHEAVAQLVLDERGRQKEALCKPGAAEHLDILQALRELYGHDKKRAEEEQLKALKYVAKFSLNKNYQAPTN